jgi:hypothetical protein
MGAAAGELEPELAAALPPPPQPVSRTALKHSAQRNLNFSELVM